MNGIKTKVIVGIVAIATAFAFGRYSAPIRVEKEIVEVEKKTEDKRKEIIKTEVVRPDGTKETTTKTVVDSKTTTDSTKSEKELVEGQTSKVSISALVGAPLTLSGPLTPVYGGHIHRPLLGPVSVGIWGLSNATAGLSFGLTF